MTDTHSQDITSQNEQSQAPQRTPFYQSHIDSEGKLVDFSGWELPIHYGSQIEEHHAVRKDAGMFDVSHMTIVDIKGADAQAYLRLRDEGISFSDYLWGFVDGKPIVNALKTDADYIAVSPESEAMSKDLKKRGFNFVGPTICYAFMQAVGMVNDHLVSCFRYEEIKDNY